jgi:hypothetical protein
MREKIARQPVAAMAGGCGVVAYVRTDNHLAHMDFLDHFLYDAYNNHSITAPENFIITNGYVMNSQHLQSQMAAD